MPTPSSALFVRRCSARHSRPVTRGSSRRAPADRLHEPYRAAHAPALEAVRADLPAGALGATLSGSGPTVIVWAEKERAGEVAAELADRFPEHEVLHLPVTTTGAGPA